MVPRAEPLAGSVTLPKMLQQQQASAAARAQTWAEHMAVDQRVELALLACQARSDILKEYTSLMGECTLLREHLRTCLRYDWEEPVVVARQRLAALSVRRGALLQALQRKRAAGASAGPLRPAGSFPLVEFGLLASAAGVEPALWAPIAVEDMVGLLAATMALSHAETVGSTPTMNSMHVCTRPDACLPTCPKGPRTQLTCLEGPARRPTCFEECSWTLVFVSAATTASSQHCGTDSSTS